jgi:hypothetical protein
LICLGWTRGAWGRWSFGPGDRREWHVDIRGDFLSLPQMPGGTGSPSDLHSSFLDIYEPSKGRTGPHPVGAGVEMAVANVHTLVTVVPLCLFSRRTLLFRILLFTAKRSALGRPRRPGIRGKPELRERCCANCEPAELSIISFLSFRPPHRPFAMTAAIL